MYMHRCQKSKLDECVAQLFSTLFFETGRSQNLDFTNVDKLAGSRNLPVLASIALGLLVYADALGFLCLCWRSELTSPILHGKQFVLSPKNHLFLDYVNDY